MTGGECPFPSSSSLPFLHLLQYVITQFLFYHEVTHPPVHSLSPSFRTGFEKKRKAVDWCGNNTAKWLQGEEPEVPAAKAIKRGPAPNLQYDDNEPHCHPPCLGDVVAVPFQDQEHGGSDFWLGKCLRLNEDGTMLLGWFQEVGKNSYRMKIGASWQEVCVCVFLPSSSCFSSLTTPPLPFSPEHQGLHLSH